MAKKNPPQKFKNKYKEEIKLFIQVFQMGVLQVEKSFPVNSLFSKTVKMGCERFCDLYLPFAPSVSELNLFKIGKGSAEIYLDPRLEGYINTSQKFGDVHEFTAPRDALGVLTSINDPLAVLLNNGARGRVRFFNFEIVFKIEKPLKEKIIKNLPKIEKNILQLPSFDAPIEKYVFLLSFLAMACVFIPFIHWLLNVPSQPKNGILNVPSEISAQFIAPENIRLLPFVFEDHYTFVEPAHLALLWVHELQLRWENGQKYKPSVPFLAKSVAYLTPKEDKINNFQKKVIDNYVTTEQSRKNNKDRYYSFLKPSPVLASIISGETGQSNYYIIDKNIQQLAKVDDAILKYLKLDHKIVKDKYEKDYNSKKIGIVTPPQTGQVLGPQPDQTFQTEFKAFKNAEFYAQISEKSQYRMHLKNFLNTYLENNKKYTNGFSSESVGLSDQNFIYPYDFYNFKKTSKPQEDFHIFLSNSFYSTGFTQLPALPKPKPVIDLERVKFVIFNKREELKSCYDSALRKNSSLNGEINISWSIDGFGRASNIKIMHNSFNDSYLFHCVESRIKVWKFPYSKNGDSWVTFPFKFMSRKKD